MVGQTRGTPEGFGRESGSGSQQPPPPPKKKNPKKPIGIKVLRPKMT